MVIVRVKLVQATCRRERCMRVKELVVGPC